MKRRASWDENTYNRVRRRYLTVLQELPAQVLRDAKEVIARAPTRAVRAGSRGYVAQHGTGQDWRKPKGTEIGAQGDEDEDEEDPLYGDADDYEADAEQDGDAEEASDDE